MSRRPRLGFLGLGWIGRMRLEALVAEDVADVVALADPLPERVEAAARSAPAALRLDSFEALRDRAGNGLALDGLVVATPSALHAEQVRTALDLGLAVFCQKPLARDAAETESLLAAARTADRLLDVDLCYRETAALRRVREIVAGGGIGAVHALDLVFHNAYGPDQAWWRDPRLSGGGCVIDLATHLVDAALWLLDFPRVAAVESRLFSGGRRLERGLRAIEDYAVATLDLEGGAVVRIACSWNLPAGRDAVISAELYGSGGGLAWTNLGGSFYDFAAEVRRGTSTERIAEPPDAWGGRRITAWARRLARDPTFDRRALELAEVARVLDRIYGGGAATAENADAIV